MAIPAGGDKGRLAVTLALMKWILKPDQQALTFGTGNITPAVKGVELSSAPAKGQAFVKKWGRPDEYPKMFSAADVVAPLEPDKLVDAFDHWDREIGSRGLAMTGESNGQFGEVGLRGVTRTFGTQVALDQLDLGLAAGEFVCLLGPSGCGKSTALNCLAGLLPLTAGSIWLDDERIDGLPPEKRGFGMVFQNYALFPHLSVQRNVEFGLKMRHVAKDEIARRVEQSLTMVQLTEHAAKYPSQLSGGQQQRVAIARAIVIEPPLVLMDEPLSNLDAKLRIEMRSEIRRIHQELSLTTVYVTHDQEEALSMADRMVVLRDGRVEQIGTPEEVYTQPTSAYVAGFMGYRNLFDLDIESAEGQNAVLAGPSLRLRGRTLGTAKVGRAVVAIRPEDFVVGDASSNGTPNGTDAVVKDVEYHGRELLVEADLEGGQTVHFRTEERLGAGDRVGLGVPADRVLVYPA